MSHRAVLPLDCLLIPSNYQFLVVKQSPISRFIFSGLSPCGTSFRCRSDLACPCQHLRLFFSNFTGTSLHLTFQRMMSALGCRTAIALLVVCNCQSRLKALPLFCGLGGFLLWGGFQGTFLVTGRLCRGAGHLFLLVTHWLGIFYS